MKNLTNIDRVIAVINEKLLFLEDKAIFAHDEERCSAGYFAKYKRFIYKAESLSEFKKLRVQFDELNKKFVELHFFARKTAPTKYKNIPVFINEPISSAVIKQSTAYQSMRVFVSERKKMKETFYTVAGGVAVAGKDDKETIAHIENLRIEVKAILKKLNSVVRTEVIDDGREQRLIVSFHEINRYLKEQGVKPKSFTKRKETGSKYTASLMPVNDDLSAIQSALGVVILHPDSTIGSDDIYRPLPRKPSAKSLERCATQLTNIGNVSIEFKTSKVWYQQQE